ncbi:MAG: hypothetical protein IIB38_09630, partial [Candidatus Hydrogenedentes bacterium]|nr:hypothetical protein [Candidatus Hydrogenedentota bacterium]
MFLTIVRLTMACTVLAFWVPRMAQAENADFLERFALAEDREAVLAELIPGTEDYYFYHCLHYQNTQRFDEVEPLLRLWIERYNRTPRVREIQNRQALLRHETDPRTSLEYIRRELGLQLNHQRETTETRANLRTTLDPNLFSRDTLARRALSWHRETVQGFEETAFDWLIERTLDPKQRRDLLQR